MRSTAFLPAIAHGLFAGSGSVAACYRHTFEECASEPAAQGVVLDRKTGATYIALPPQGKATEVAAEKFANGEIVGRAAAARDETLGQWSTRIAPA